MPRTYLPLARADRLIAAARLVMVLFTMLAVWLDPELAGGSAQRVLTIVAVVFTLYAAVLAALSGRMLLSDRARMALHVTDFVMYSILVYVTQGTVVFFIFWIFCGVLRFGTRGAIISAGVAVLTYVALTLSLVALRAEPGRAVLRYASLTTVSLLVVSFGAYEGRVRAELSEIAAWPQRGWANRESLLNETLSVARELMRARTAAILWEEAEEPWVWFGWLHDDQLFKLSREGPEFASFLVDENMGEETFLCDWSRGATLFNDDRGPRTIRVPLIPDATRERLDLGTAAVSSVFKSDLVQGRLIFGFSRRISIDDMPLSDVIARLVAARLDHAASAERMRDSAVGEERIRVARDLHDGLLQSLTGVALQLESVLRLIGADDDAARARVRSAQQIIEGDQRELRSFITQLRPESAPPRTASLVARLEMLATRFERQWNVAVAVDVEPPAPAISESLSAEIYNIVNEAASNAAKHAGGTRIDVDVRVGDDTVLIIVRDDGRGFPFHGTYDLTALDDLKRGPVTLKERVSSLNGGLRLQSSSDGTRLEVTLAL